MTEPTRAATPEPRVINEARIDEIEGSWASASGDARAEMLEDLRVVVEDDPDHWSPEYRDKAHALAKAVADALPDTAEPEPDARPVGPDEEFRDSVAGSGAADTSDGEQVQTRQS